MVKAQGEAKARGRAQSKQAGSETTKGKSRGRSEAKKVVEAQQLKEKARSRLSQAQSAPKAAGRGKGKHGGAQSRGPSRSSKVKAPKRAVSPPGAPKRKGQGRSAAQKGADAAASKKRTRVKESPEPKSSPSSADSIVPVSRRKASKQAAAETPSKDPSEGQIVGREPKGQGCSEWPRKGHKSLRGHYDVLEILRTASQAEVREGYRRRALSTHPDKGGSPEAFRKVVLAFENLSDPVKRAVYDASLDRRGCLDGESRGPRPPVMEESPRGDLSLEQLAFMGAARIAFAELGDMRKDQWPRKLKKINNDVLNALAQWLLGSTRPPTWATETSPASASDGAQSAAAEARAKLFGGVGISEDKAGRLSVELSWGGMRIRTQKTYSLGEVVEWHIALTGLKANALERAKKMIREAESKKKGRKREREELINLEDRAPITYKDLLETYKAFPTLRLVFASFHGTGKQRILLPYTQDLRLALRMQAEFQKLMGEGKTTVDTKTLGAMRQLKNKAHAEIAQAKATNDLLERDLLRAVVAELDARGIETPEKLQRPKGLRSDGSTPNDMEEKSAPMTLQMKIALELRDALGFDHEGACAALEKLKVLALTDASLTARKTVLFSDGPLPMLTDLPALEAVVGATGARMTKDSLVLQYDEPAEMDSSSPSFSSSPAAKRRRTFLEAPEPRVTSWGGVPAPGTPGVPKALPLPPRPPRSMVRVTYSGGSSSSAPSQGLAKGLRSVTTLKVLLSSVSELLKFLDFPTLAVLRQTSRAMKSVADEEVKRVCRDFTYTEFLFTWTALDDQDEYDMVVPRFLRFITCPRHQTVFKRLNLADVPIAALQDPRFLGALSRMPNLEHLSYPSTGWTSSEARRKFLQAVPASVDAWRVGVRGLMR